MKAAAYNLWMLISLAVFIESQVNHYDFWVRILMIMPLSIGFAHTGYMLYRKEPK